MLRFGPGGIPLAVQKEGIEKAIVWCGENGLSCMEMEFVHSTWLKENKYEAVRELSRKHDVALTAHGSYYINLNAKEEEKRAASRNRVLSAAYATAAVGGRSVTFHPAYYLGQDPEKVYQVVKEQMQLILDELAENDVKVLLSPETTGKPTQFGHYKELVRLAKELPIGICVDFAHLHARSNGEYNSYEEFCSVLQHIKDELGQERLENMHIHLSGIAYGPKGEKHHLVMEESDYNFADLFRAFKKFNVGGCLISESPVIEEDALRFKELYEKVSDIDKQHI
ncbi:MAG: TIM barrel protein [Candidatus Woesearchaeota archaeon]